MAIFKRKRGDVIDLVAWERALARPKYTWGLPSPCPACGAAGYLDHIDMVRRVMHQHCPTCFAKWQTTEAETLTTVP